MFAAGAADDPAELSKTKPCVKQAPTPRSAAADALSQPSTWGSRLPLLSRDSQFSFNQRKLPMSTDRHKDISTVRRWLAHRGYGFIVADGGGQSNDIFVHIRHVQTAKSSSRVLA